MENSNHPINHKWSSYYRTLERIRKSGICNMWGAAPYLAQEAKIPQSLATDVLLSWISNYDELKKIYNW